MRGCFSLIPLKARAVQEVLYSCHTTPGALDIRSILTSWALGTKSAMDLFTSECLETLSGSFAAVWRVKQNTGRGESETEYWKRGHGSDLA